MAGDERVAVIDLADELQVREQTVFKVIRRLGLRREPRRDPDRGNQLVATLAHEDAALVRGDVLRAAAGPGLAVALDGAATLEHRSICLPRKPAVLGLRLAFLLVEFEPEHDPGRFKVGFTVELEGRLRKHRCSAPFARHVKTWPCRRTWERAAIDCVTRDCERLHTEVFRAPVLDAAYGRAAQFFAMMPRLTFGPDGEGADLLGAEA